MVDRVKREQQSRREARGAAFSLVELMVALTVGGIALGSIYSIGSASTRHFREQQHIASTQTSLRMAMDQLKRDFQRAGFLGTPNAGVAREQCGNNPPPATLNAPGNSGPIAAIARFTDNVALNRNPNNNDYVDRVPTLNGATVDEVVLTGNYSTGGEYAQIQVTNSNVVGIPQNWQSVRRDFSNWASGADPTFNTGAGNAFDNAFVVNRMVRIHMLGEVYHFAQITAKSLPASAGALATVTINPSLPSNCSGTGGWISPLNTVRYAVRNATATEDPSSAKNFDNNTMVNDNGSMAILRRTEVLPTDKLTALVDPATNAVVDDRALLEYVVGFNLRFLTTAGAANTIAWLPATQAAVTANPERVVGVIIDLAVRTPAQEPTLAFDPGRTFKVYQIAGTPDWRGAARMRTAHAELFLPNIAYKGF